MTDMGTDLPASGVPAAVLLLRIVLLLASATVAGIGLLRPAVAATPRGTVVIAWIAAAVTAVADVISLLWLDTNLAFAIGQLLLAVAVPATLRWRTPATYLGFGLLVVLISEISLSHMGIEFLADTGYTVGVVAWLGLTLIPPAPAGRLRPKPVALTLAIVLALAGVLQIAVSGIGFDRRLYDTGFGLALLLVALLPIVVTVLTLALPVPRLYPVGALLVVIAYVAWAALGAIPRPTDLPTPGVPLLGDASGAPVLVAPQRPGRNLVHLPDAATVNGVKAVARPGMNGTWAEIDLPPGRSTLQVFRDGKDSTLAVDTGSGATARAVDPECANAALGGLIGGSRLALTSCPSDSLSTEDTDSVHKLVDYLKGRKIPAVTVVGDGSARAKAAEEVVRQAGIPVSDTEQPNSALVVVAGWSDAATELAKVAVEQTQKPTYVYGVYLAPWLLTAPLLKSVVSSAIPLHFDPRDPRTLAYTVALSNAFPGETGTIGGLDQWLAAQGQQTEPAVRLYASAQVDAMPMDSTMDGMEMAYPGQWVPNGTIVPISGPLS
ncbi:DUF6239 family natural product biosynthesis protein [Kutzneria sp. CA-103260]|uniref:DUF6239 family natural product biosynthesis protein n=1 Tax=Kutzneria sp. CA-103260 TaxID=2802641 RepID=UPI001BA67A67|nr:DUF6239 family natural product biosynthesis protein [Kutzneria sp. CA-103260]QUQ71139.1 hypothetical protein JJ691_89220 [Kutzneria sp. CA-103260]